MCGIGASPDPSPTMRRTREDWKRVIAELRGSGMSSKEFAKRRRLNLSTLRWWASELRDEASTEIVKFVPVEAEVASVVVRGVVEAQVGAVTLRFESGADLDYIAGLLGRLGREC